MTARFSGPRIGLVDPSIGQERPSENPLDVNVGDQIIAEAVQDVLETRIGASEIFRVPSLRPLSKSEIDRLNEMDYVLVGGTNILSSHVLRYRQLRWRLADIFKVNKVILLGVGWWSYQAPPDFFTRLILRRLLSSSSVHSVRDEFTRSQLAKSGMRNVENTSCPTLWGLNGDLIDQIPTDAAENVVFTLTYYRKERKQDRALIETLCSFYNEVYFWPQGDQDLEYLRELVPESTMLGIQILRPTLEGFDSLLAGATPVDYVGTRLHAGIRALQKKRRSLIVSIDNRAKEISRDTGLPILERQEINRLTDILEGELRPNISLPEDAIRSWCKQFVR